MPEWATREPLAASPLTTTKLAATGVNGRKIHEFRQTPRQAEAQTSTCSSPERHQFKFPPHNFVREDEGDYERHNSKGIAPLHLHHYFSNMPPHKRPFKSAEAQPSPPLAVLPQPTVRQRGELAMENWDLSTASEPERARAQGLVDAFNAIKGDMSGVWREELAAFVHDCTWQRLASNPSSLESYKKLKGNAGRQKQLYFPYWFGVATYFPPSHATLQPIREELSQLWGVNLPFDRIYYPRVDAKKESACFQGNIPTLEPTLLPTGNDPTPVRRFTPINAATTLSLQQPSVTQSTFAPSNLFPVARPGPSLTLKPIQKEKPTGLPTPRTAALADHDWNMAMSKLKERMERFSSPVTTPQKRTVTFDSTVDDQRSSSPLSRSDGRPFSRPLSPARPTGQRLLPAPPAPTDVEQPAVRKRSLGFGPGPCAWRRLTDAWTPLRALMRAFRRDLLRQTTTTRNGVKLGEIGSVVDDAAKDLEENWNMHYKYRINSLNWHRILLPLNAFGFLIPNDLGNLSLI
ncbi:hypothetical protein BKA56DRAFT_618194 [Ilyonectria sp. MPI-CAGE-AT-0026]|nr:hypothetical protein BKA56DRAFT_618194 [Ilyonectria sp. MPI-CAGE-AT-0026]